MNPNNEVSCKNDDHNSVISERCWEEKYRGDSRKWLIRDGTTSGSQALTCSTMKETYRPAYQDDPPCVGIRRSQFREKLYNEIAEEIIRENNQPPPVKEYCTEYDGNFNYPGYDSEAKPERNTELYLKYPLYASEAASYWKFKIDSYPRGQASLLGFTTAIDIKQPFKRNSEFTKPISEVLDNDSVQ